MAVFVLTSKLGPHDGAKSKHASENHWGPPYTPNGSEFQDTDSVADAEDDQQEMDPEQEMDPQHELDQINDLS